MSEKKPITITAYTVVEVEAHPGNYLHTFYSNTVLQPDFLSHDGEGLFLIPADQPAKEEGKNEALNDHP